MFFTSKRPTIQTAVAAEWLAILDSAAAAALLTTPVVELFISGPPLTGNDVYANYKPCTFAGYLPAQLKLNKAGNLLNGDQARTAPAYFEVGAGNTIDESALGYLVSDGAAKIYMAEFFPSPVPFSAPGDFLDLDVIWPVSISPIFAVQNLSS